MTIMKTAFIAHLPYVTFMISTLAVLITASRILVRKHWMILIGHLTIGLSIAIMTPQIVALHLGFRSLDISYSQPSDNHSLAEALMIPTLIIAGIILACVAVNHLSQQKFEGKASTRS